MKQGIYPLVEEPTLSKRWLEHISPWWLKQLHSPDDFEIFECRSNRKPGWSKQVKHSAIRWEYVENFTLMQMIGIKLYTVQEIKESTFAFCIQKDRLKKTHKKEIMKSKEYKFKMLASYTDHCYTAIFCCHRDIWVLPYAWFIKCCSEILYKGYLAKIKILKPKCLHRK